MIKLNKTSYEIISPFVDKETPNLAVLLAIIRHKAKGDIWVDDVENPQVTFVNTGSLFSFLLGSINKAAICEVLDIIKEHPVVYTYIPSAVAVNDLFKDKKKVLFVQHVFNNSFQHTISKIIKTISNGLALKQIGQTDFPKCDWFELFSSIYGSEDEFHNNSFGFCIYSDSKVISEAYAGYLVDNIFEVATTTHRDYRRRDLATIVCAQLIDYALNKGLVPVWSCEKQNTGSLATARKLGFDIKSEYELWNLA